MKRYVAWFWVLGLFAQATAWAAPALDDDRREGLRGYVALEDADEFGRGPALYRLLENAAQWEADDFAGDGGAAVAPTPDYDTLRAHPEMIGNAFVIEGYFVEQIRFPDPEGEGPTRLPRSGNPLWEDNLTRWAINTSPKGQDPDQTVLVYFVDPEGNIEAPPLETRVRVAARFYKAWEVEDQEGRPFEFLTFVGGAREVVNATSGTPRGGFMNAAGPVLVPVIAVFVAFYFVRKLLAHMSKKHAGHTSIAMRSEMRHNRETADSEDEEEADPNLPEDPGDALAYLRERDAD